MKNISLAFDLDSRKDSKGEKKPPSLGSVPDLPSYMSYCLFPGTTVFGPFLTYSEHSKFLHPTPLVSKENNQNVFVHYSMIHVKLALPTLGAWSMAGLLGQPLEYYYYYYYYLYTTTLFTLDHAVDMEDFIKPSAFSHLPWDVSLHFAIPIY